MDRMNKGDITMEWCPTGSMIADYLTKPLQGSTFHKLQDTIMGANDSAGGYEKGTKSNPGLVHG